MVSGKKQTAFYLGEIPEMSNANNSTRYNIASFDILSIPDFQWILFISKDRYAWKTLAYRKTTLARTLYGPLRFDYRTGVTESESYSASFSIAARTASDEPIVINHTRMTSTSGRFYSYYPQKFDVYALTEYSWEDL